MRPEQRSAALRLARQLDFLAQPFAHEAADLLRELAAEPVQEPVAYIHAWKSRANVIGRTLSWNATSPHGDDMQISPLYTHPPQQRKPLSNDEIKRCVDDAIGRGLNVVDQLSDFTVSVARAIERAHGIGEAP